MISRPLKTLAYATVVLFCSAVAVLFGISRERADVTTELAYLDQQISAEFNASVRLAALLSAHRDIYAVFLSDDPNQQKNDALDRLVIETARSAIIVLFPDGRIAATGTRNPDKASPITSVPAARSLKLSPFLLSRRFVFTDADGWLFETGKAIYGPNQTLLGHVLAYQPLTDAAQIWSALPDNLSLETSDGRVLYDHKRFATTGWGLLSASAASVAHGTVMTIERSPQILLGYCAVGLVIGLAISLAFFVADISRSRRRVLTQARIDALAESADLLEAQVAKRTQELKDSQAELVQTAKLQVLNDMAIGLSHELSQPLFALEASLDTLQCQLGMQPRVQKSLEQTQRVTERMGQILNSLKSFARKDDADPVLMDLSQPVAAALAMLDHRAATHDIKVTHNVQADPIMARATATRLQQVVVNVVSNSLDAVPKDGTGLVQVDYVDGPKIRITDNGPGFEDFGSALTPFATTKSDQNSLGLGLAISARIMSRFDGSITLSEGPLGGANVTLNFDSQKKE